MRVVKQQTKQRRCVRCGKMFSVKKWSKAKVCRECRSLIQKELVRQLKQGQGEMYDRWLDGLDKTVQYIKTVKTYTK